MSAFEMISQLRQVIAHFLPVTNLAFVVQRFVFTFAWYALELLDLRNYFEATSGGFFAYDT
jgi:hypothetical protein